MPARSADEFIMNSDKEQQAILLVIIVPLQSNK